MEISSERSSARVEEKFEEKIHENLAGIENEGVKAEALSSANISWCYMLCPDWNQRLFGMSIIFFEK
jgi:hypothetical protein